MRFDDEEREAEKTGKCHMLLNSLNS